MHRAAPSAVSQAHRPGDGVGNAAGIVNHQRFLGRRGRHAYLINLLHCSPSQLGQVGGTGDGQQRAFAVHGVSQSGDGIGEAGRGVHTDA